MRICHWLELILLLTIQAAAEIQSRVLLLLILLSLLPATCIFLEESTGISIASICVTFLVVAVGSCFYTATRLDSMQQRVFKLALATEANYFQVLHPTADTSEHLIQVSTMLTNHSGGLSQELAQPEQDLKSRYIEALCQLIHFQRAVCDPLASMGLEVVANIKSVTELDEREGTADNILYFEVMSDGLQQVQDAWEMLQTLDVEIVSAHDFFAVASSRKCCRIVVSLRGYLATIFLLEKSLSFLESQRGLSDAANSLGLLDKTTAASWQASGRQGASEFPRSVFAATALLRLLALYSSFIIAIFIHKLGSGKYDPNEQGPFSPRLSAMALPFWVCGAVLLWEFLRSCCDTFADGSTRALKIRPRPTQVWYRKYLGVQGRYYAFKVAALQLITVVIQGLAKASLFGAIRDQRSSEALNSASVHCFMGLLLCNCIFPALVLAFPNCVSSRVGAAVMDAFLDFGYLITSLWVYIDFASPEHFAPIFLETFLNYASIYICIAHILCVCRSLETADWASLFQVQHAEPMWGPVRRRLFSSAYACALVIFVGVMLGDIVYLHEAGPCSPCSCSATAPGSLLLERCPFRSGYFAYRAPPLALDLAKRNITEILPDAFLAAGRVRSRVTSLSLRGNHLTELPEGLFVDLLDQDFINITSLDLGYNRLMALSAGVFQTRSARKVRMDSLHLESNHFTTLPAGVFKGVEVDQVYLRNNNLTQLHAEAFHGLTFGQNRTLDISQNNLRQLPPKVFDGLELDRLYLQNNNLSQLHAETFQGLTFGQNGILDMSRNKLQTLHADTFQNLTFGQNGILDMSQNTLQVLHAEAFHGLTFGGNGMLDMSHNQLRALIAETFRGLAFSENGILDMSKNQLQDLPPKLFDGLWLKGLYLQKNDLSQLHAQTLHGLTFGQNGILDMSQNQLQELSADTFHGLIFGEKFILNMSQNTLQVLHADTFQGLTFGQNGILDMSQNKLHILHADTFQGLTFGQNGILDMSRNKLQTLHSDTFQGLAFGQNGILTMSQNQLQELSADTFHGLIFGEKFILNMSQNTLQVLHADTFQGLTFGQNGILDMSQNKLHILHADTFQGLTFGQNGILDMSQNALQVLHADTFQGLTFGENGILDMSQNKLHILHADTFQGLTFGQNGILDMSQNKLHILHADTFQGLTFGQNGTLDMSQNKLQILHADTFQGLTFGQNGILDMSQNKLQTLHAETFQNLTFGEKGILDMSQNTLQVLHADTFQGLTFGQNGILTCRRILQTPFMVSESILTCRNN